MLQLKVVVLLLLLLLGLLVMRARGSSAARGMIELELRRDGRVSGGDVVVDGTDAGHVQFVEVVGGAVGRRGS